MDVDLPTAALQAHWEDVVSDLEATADELADAGWTTLVLHAGDCTTRTGDDAGLSVLVPGPEYEQLEALVADGTAFSETVVYRSAAGGVAFVVCELRDAERLTAVLVPAFYPQRGRAAKALAARAHERGSLDIHVHPLARDRVVTVTIDEPSLVFPAEWT